MVSVHPQIVNYVILPRLEIVSSQINHSGSMGLQVVYAVLEHLF